MRDYAVELEKRVAFIQDVLSKSGAKGIGLRATPAARIPPSSGSSAKRRVTTPSVS